MQKRVTEKQTKVHWLAAKFPMMDKAGLAEMAESIKANGQYNPITYDPDGVLLDGRNREAACKIAGVEPRSEVYDGDPVEFILDLNVRRRDLNAGQRAMAMAIAYPEAKIGRPRKGEKSQDTLDFSTERLRQARRINDFNPALAQAVLDGTGIKFDEALEEVEKAQRAERTLKQRYAKLHEEDPDLSARVNADELTLEEAETLARENRESADIKREENTDKLLSALILLNPHGDVDSQAKDLASLLDYGGLRKKLKGSTDESVSTVLTTSGQVLAKLALLLKKKE